MNHVEKPCIIRQAFELWRRAFDVDSPWQDLPAWQWVMWLRTFFMVLQWGSAQARTSPLACSRRWHLWAWSSRTSCCWISLRFSGSAVGPTDTCCCCWGCGRENRPRHHKSQLSPTSSILLVCVMGNSPCSARW